MFASARASSTPVMFCPAAAVYSAGPNVIPASVDWNSENIWFATPMASTRVPLTGSRNASVIDCPATAPPAICQPQLRSSE